MRNAISVKTARARATIAAGILKTVKPWPRGWGLGRTFDNCFEMGDGHEVTRILHERAKTDSVLAEAMRRNGCEQILDPIYVNRKISENTPQQIQLSEVTP